MPQLATEREESAGRHVSRHFQALPDIAQASARLDAITDAIPDHAAVPMDLPLGLYGAGNLGRMARDFLKSVWLDFDFVIDRNAVTLRQSSDWHGITVYHPDEVPEHIKQSHLLLVTVATAPYVPLEVELARIGFQNILPFYDFAEQFRHLHPLSNGWFARAFSPADKGKAAAVLAGFGDDLSRAHHLQFLAWRRLRQEWTFASAPVTGNDRFFIPEIGSALKGNDVLVDGGAHHGSVTLEFDRRFPGWKQIVAIEPDDENRAALAQAFGERWPEDGGRRPSVLECALGAASTNGTFHSGLGYASQLSMTGGEQVEILPVDALDLKPTFIKLHLEGGELDALKGATQTIERHRPVIAATVYHNDDGIWKTPLWMMQSLSEYAVLFRLHSWCGTGAVLYAIPAERMR